jgi:methylenetetrahydrofolate reductase (NADPH)
MKRLLLPKSNDEIRAVGVEWGIQQAKELMAKGVPCLHFYSMGKAEPVCQIAKALF